MTNTNQYYIERIDKALSYITKTLSEQRDPQLDDIAQAAYLSKFHFHRIYRLITGETCQQTIQRIKLSIATETLARENGSVTMAAMNANYSSSQALAKALKRATGHTPSELKKDAEQLAVTLERLQLPDEHASGLIAVELTQLSPIQYIAREADLPYEQLNLIYEQLFMDAGGPENVFAIIGASLGNQPELTAEQAVFECGLVLNNFAGKATKTRNGGHYLLLRHQGPYNHLDKSVDQLYQYLLSQDKSCFADDSLLFHYLDDPEEVTEDELRTDIYLPISLISA